MAGEVRRLTRPHDPVEAHIGARLRTARQAAGLTLAAVAEQAGLTKGFLSRLERDEVSPSVASLVTVCGVLGIGVGTLFEAPETSLVRAGEAPPINFGGRGLHESLLTLANRGFALIDRLQLAIDIFLFLLDTLFYALDFLAACC